MDSVHWVHRRFVNYAALAVRLATFAFVFAVSPGTASLFAQTSGSIVLIQDAQGRQVFVNAPVPTPARAASIPSPAASGAALRRPAAFENLVERTARRLQVDPELVNAIIRVESQFDARAVSPKGAMGLMQLMPATANSLGVEHPFDPKENVKGGVTYLRWLLDRFNGSVPLSLAAYNAGEDRVAKDGGIPHIAETTNYVRKVTSIYRAGQRARTATAEPPRADESIYSYEDVYGVTHFTNDGNVD